MGLVLLLLTFLQALNDTSEQYGGNQQYGADVLKRVGAAAASLAVAAAVLTTPMAAMADGLVQVSNGDRQSRVTYMQMRGL